MLAASKYDIELLTTQRIHMGLQTDRQTVTA